MTRGACATRRPAAATAPWRMTPACSCAHAGQEAGRVDEHDERQAEAVAQLTNQAPFSSDSASRQPPRWWGWLAMTPTGVPSMRAKPTTRLRAQRGAELEQLAGVDHAARRRRARRRPRARARAATRPGRPAAGRPAGAAAAGRPTRGQVGQRRRARPRPRDVVARRRGAPRRCAPWTFGPPSSSAVTCSRVTRSTTAGPVRNIFASWARHDREVAERGRVGRAAGARAADRR